MKQYLLPGIVCLVCISCHVATTGSKPDTDFDTTVANPQLTSSKPRILFDEAHHNVHHINNTFAPFANVLKHDGCDISATDDPITDGLLTQADIYITIAAQGETDPGDASPFTPDEITILERWVQSGGSVLIVTEHYPFGIAMSPLLHQFGVTVHNGYTEDSLLNNPAEPGALLFEKGKGNLNAEHPILANVERINTFTGTAIKGDSSYIPLLIFSDQAQNFTIKIETKTENGDVKTEVTYDTPYSAAGYAQGICAQYGRGKIVVLAEAGMLSAQIDRQGHKYGMNIPNTDNKQFLLNTIRWLSSK